MHTRLPPRSRQSTTRALIEALEPRDYLSLEPSISGNLPAALVSDQKTSASVTVTLTNTGNAAIKGPYTLTIYADQGATLDGTQTQIVSLHENLPSLAAGQTKNVTVKLGTLPDLTDGNYFLIAQTTGSLSDNGGDSGASAGTIAIGPAFVDLTGSATVLSPTSLQLKGGQPAKFAVTVINNGNVTAKGELDINEYTSQNADGSDPSYQGTVRENINLAPNGGHHTWTFTQKIPADFAPGSYFLVGTINPNHTLLESSYTNNTFLSPQALTIISPFPNALGNFTVTATGTKGPEKGAATTIMLDVTAQTADGVLSGTATINDVPGNLNGTLTTTGKLTLTTTSIGKTYTLKGTLKNGAFSGTFTTSDGGGGKVVSASLVGTLVGMYAGTATDNQSGDTTPLTIDVQTENPAGDITGSINGALFLGIYSEATGTFDISFAASDDSGSYHVTLSGTAFGGAIFGDYFDHVGDDPSGTFNVSQDV